MVVRHIGFVAACALSIACLTSCSSTSKHEFGESDVVGVWNIGGETIEFLPDGKLGKVEVFPTLCSKALTPLVEYKGTWVRSSLDDAEDGVYVKFADVTGASACNVYFEMLKDDDGFRLNITGQERMGSFRKG